MSKFVLTISVLLFGSFSTMTGALAQDRHDLTMAVGEPGSESFVLGTELWAMGQISLRTQHGIALATQQMADESERLTSLHNADVDIALVQDDVPVSYGDHGRTVMMLWPSGGSTGGQAKPAQILARGDVPEELVYQLTKAVFENTKFFKASGERFNLTTPDRALIGAALPIHPGASRYYREIGVEEAPASRSTASFANFDDDALDQAERDQIAAACRQALDLGALSAVLGDLSSAGCEVYQSYLEDQAGVRRQEAVVESEYVTLPQSGQGGPAIALESVDGRDEPLALSPNRVSPVPAAIRIDPRQPTM